MDQRFRPASLVPAGLIVDGVSIEADLVLVRVRSPVAAGRCPDCGATSQRIQSRYWRRAKDLPLSGRRVELQVLVRRFRCDGVLCGRQIFAERFNTGVLAVRSPCMGWSMIVRTKEPIRKPARRSGPNTPSLPRSGCASCSGPLSGPERTSNRINPEGNVRAPSGSGRPTNLRISSCGASSPDTTEIRGLAWRRRYKFPLRRLHHRSGRQISVRLARKHLSAAHP